MVTRAHRKRGRRLDWLPLLLGATVFVLAVYGAARIAYASSHPKPFFDVGSDLTVRDTPQFKLDFVGLDKTAKLTALNGVSVDSYADYLQALHAAEEPIDLMFETPTGEPFKVVWINHPAIPEIEANEGLVLRSVAEFTAAELGLAGPARLTSLNRQPIQSLAELPKAIKNDNRSNVWVELSENNADASVHLLIRLVNWNVAWTLWAVGIAFGLIGTGTVYLQRKEPAAVAFALFCGNVTFFWLARAIPGESRFPFEGLAYFASFSALPATTFGVVATFTPVSMLLTSPFGRLRAGVACLTVAFMAFVVWSSSENAASTFPWRALLIMAAFAGIPAAYAARSFAASQWRPSVSTHCRLAEVQSALIFLFGVGAFPKVVNHGLLDYSVGLPWLLLMLLILVLAQTGDWLCSLLGLAVSAVFKERSRVVRLASLMGFGPTLAYSTYVMATDQFPSELRLLLESLTVLFPALIGYAIVRRNFLRVDDIVLQAVTVALVSLLWLASYVAIMVLVDRGVGSLFTEYAVYVRGALIALLTAATMPAYLFVRSRARKAFKETAGDIASVERLLDDSYATHATLDDYWRDVSDVFKSRFLASRSLLLVPDAQSPWGGSSAANNRAEEHGRAVLAALGAGRDAVAPGTDLDGELDALGAEVELPLMAHGGLVGAVLLGPEANNRPYAAQDLRDAERLASRVALHVHSYREAESSRSGSRIADLYPRIPSRIGRYRVHELIGEGGMSHVFRAEDDGRQVAIKVPNRRVQDDETLMMRFLRESSVLLRLHHPNIVEVVEIGVQGREPYIVMEYFGDGSLKAQLRRIGAFPEDRVLSILIQTVRGLSAALDKGVVHRDVKPHNLFMTDGGIVKVGDFGLAEISHEDSLTQTGLVLGTKAYLAPEVLSRGEHSPWSDQFALGITGYELLLGTRPDTTDSDNGSLSRHIATTLRNAAISPALSGVIEKLLAPTPSLRFENYGVLESALEEALKDVSHSSKRAL